MYPLSRSLAGPGPRVPRRGSEREHFERHRHFPVCDRVRLSRLPLAVSRASAARAPRPSLRGAARTAGRAGRSAAEGEIVCRWLVP